MTNKLTVTTQDQENVRTILAKHNVVNAKVRINTTGSKFAPSFDILVNGVLFAKYYGSQKDISTGLTSQYTYTLVA